jgi:hypothetical protein
LGNLWMSSFSRHLTISNSPIFKFSNSSIFKLTHYRIINQSGLSTLFIAHIIRDFVLAT